MIDIYSAAIHANLCFPTPLSPVVIRYGLARLTAGIVILCSVYGNLS
jgi:hypothetical protein